MNVRAAFPFILLVLSLTACSGEYPASVTMSTPSPQPSPSSTPDMYEQLLQTVQMQGTLNSMQQSASEISAQLTAAKMLPTWDVVTSTAIKLATQDSGTATTVFETTGTARAKTAIAESWTPTPIPTSTPDFVGTLQASEVKATEAALHREAEGHRLALERQELMNKVYAVVPMAALIVLMGFALSLAWRWSQVRVIQRDLRGDAPLIITGATVYDADRNPQPVLDMATGRPVIPNLTDPAVQAATTNRDQMVDLATRGAPSNARRRAVAQRLAQPQPMQPALPPIEIVDAQEVKNWIDEAEQKLLTDGGAE